MKRKRAARAAVTPAPAPGGAPLPRALAPVVRSNLQGLLNRIEAATPILRASGMFDVLGLLSQAGHALKLVADHSTALERALETLAPAPAPAPEVVPPAPPSSTTANGVKQA